MNKANQLVAQLHGTKYSLECTIRKMKEVLDREQP
jgi:hypothetical protein